MLDSVVCAPGFWRTSCDKSGESDIFLTTSIEEWRHADPVGSSTSLLCFCFYHHFAPTIQRFGPDPGLDGLDLEQTPHCSLHMVLSRWEITRYIIRVALRSYVLRFSPGSNV